MQVLNMNSILREEHDLTLRILLHTFTRVACVGITLSRAVVYPIMIVTNESLLT